MLVLGYCLLCLLGHAGPTVQCWWNSACAECPCMWWLLQMVRMHEDEFWAEISHVGADRETHAQTRFDESTCVLNIAMQR